MSDTERGETLPGRPPEPAPEPAKTPGDAAKTRPPPAGGGAMPDGPQGDEVDPGVG